MANEPSYWRFFAYLNLFVFSMLLLVLGDNFVMHVLRLGGRRPVQLPAHRLLVHGPQERARRHEGVRGQPRRRLGLSRRPVAAVLGARAGRGRTIDHRYYVERRARRRRRCRFARRSATQLRVPMFAASFSRRKTIFGAPVPLVVALFLLLGACGKSAQVPLYVWLPDAMAGPTPVSALIHAATMVTAGVYLVARLHFLFVAVAGGADGRRRHRRAHRALRRATIGLFQYDIKKVLAYSTISQLGFMFIGVGVGAYWAGVFHLVTHAFFKACLFLGSGSVIHGMHRLTHARHTGHLEERRRRRRGRERDRPPRARLRRRRAPAGAARSARRGRPDRSAGHAQHGRAGRAHAADRAGPTSSPAGRSPAFPGRPASGPRTRSWPPAFARSRLVWLVGVATAALHRVLHVPQLLPHLRGAAGDAGAPAPRARVAARR